MSRYLNFHFPTTSTRSHLRHLRSPHGGSHTTPVDSWPIPWRFDMNFPTLRPGKKRVTVGSFITLPFFEQREKKPGGFFSRFQDGFFPTDVFVQSTLFLFRKCRKRRNGWWEKKNIQKSPNMCWRIVLEWTMTAFKGKVLVGLPRTEQVCVECFGLRMIFGIDFVLHLVRAKKAPKKPGRPLRNSSITLHRFLQNYITLVHHF